MLVIDQGRPQLDIRNLLQKPPDNISEIISRYYNADATLFHHIVSSPDCRYEKKFGSGRIPTSTATMNSRDRFKNIIISQNIIGNPKGFFVNKSNPKISASHLSDIKSVSFAFSKYENVKQHFSARGSRYGIVFHHNFLEKKGIRPVVYLNDNSEDELKRVLFTSPHLLEVVNNTYDMRWENEWRIKNELKFERDDVAFLIVPDEDFVDICQWIDENTKSSNIFDEYLIIPASLFDDPICYLSMLQHLQHESWSKIPISEQYSVYLDEFLDCTLRERAALESAVGQELNCLSRAVLNQLYEAKYVESFLKFANDIQIKSIESIMGVDLNMISRNYSEPSNCVRDLIIIIYRELFEIQKHRIFSGELENLEK